jgi:hypothetical protein
MVPLIASSCYQFQSSSSKLDDVAELTGAGAEVGLSTDGIMTLPCTVIPSSSSSSQLPVRGKVLKVGVRREIERASGELVSDDGVRREAVLGEGLHSELVVDDSVRGDDVDGAGAGVVATAPGDSADAMDCETSARRTEARFWLLENLNEMVLVQVFGT